MANATKTTVSPLPSPLERSAEASALTHRRMIIIPLAILMKLSYLFSGESWYTSEFFVVTNLHCSIGDDTNGSPFLQILFTEIYELNHERQYFFNKS